MVAVIVAMGLVDDVRPQLWWSLGSLAVVLGLARWHTTRHDAEERRRPVPHGRGPAATPS